MFNKNRTENTIKSKVQIALILLSVPKVQADRLILFQFENFREYIRIPNFGSKRNRVCVRCVCSFCLSSDDYNFFLFESPCLVLVPNVASTLSIHIFRAILASKAIFFHVWRGGGGESTFIQGPMMEEGNLYTQERKREIDK